MKRVQNHNSNPFCFRQEERTVTKDVNPDLHPQLQWVSAGSWLIKQQQAFGFSWRSLRT